jgi:ABC-type dipeptide/oligopeptide/nickel transport system permease component
VEGDVRGLDYVVKRSGFALVTIFVTITINFFLFRVLPGSAVSNLSHVPHATPALRHALTVEFGLDKSKWEQYWLYLGQLVQGNLGISFANQQSVSSILIRALGNTIPLVLIGTIIALLIGIVTGVLAAASRGSWRDAVHTNVAIVFYAFPTQFLGLMLLILFASWLPSAGMTDPFALHPSAFVHLEDIGLHMILPALTLVLTLYGETTLIVRSAMLETMGEDYVLTARAQGMARRRIIWRDAFRNAMLPTITQIGLSLGSVVTGALLIEVIFSWPGIGMAMENAVLARDYPVLQGGFLIITISVVLTNLLTDLLYFRLDPRVTT